MITSVRKFLKVHERLLMPVFLVFGFLVDTITLNRIDQIFDNAVLLFYLFLASGSILILYSSSRFWEKYIVFIPFVIQYAFGGIFSGLLIFYFRSGDFLVSFPFLVILIFLFLANDMLHRKYSRLLFQTTVLYIAILSYSLLITPIILRRLNVWTFFAGTILSLVLIYLFTKALEKVDIDKKAIKKIYRSVGLTFSICLLLYFANIIPPIPLSLKEGFVAIEVVRTSENTYWVTEEKQPWYLFFKKHSNSVHLPSNQPVYFFSSVFAPTNLESTIFHEWSYFDPNINRWIETDRIPIQIKGGRDNGFRGFSQKSSIVKGTWRVDIETQSGQVIGRVRFNIEDYKEKMIINSEY